MAITQFNEDKIAKLYKKFAKEDQKLEEEGMVDYVANLIEEDKK